MKDSRNRKYIGTLVESDYTTTAIDQLVWHFRNEQPNACSDLITDNDDCDFVFLLTHCRTGIGIAATSAGHGTSCPRLVERENLTPDRGQVRLPWQSICAGLA